LTQAGVEATKRQLVSCCCSVPRIRVEPIDKVRSVFEKIFGHALSVINLIAISGKMVISEPGKHIDIASLFLEPDLGPNGPGIYKIISDP
jgi:hypothetical protein